MASAIPSGFVDIFTASNRLNTSVSIMGVVTDVLPPSRSRGTDWICTFSVADSTLGGDYDQGLKVRFFKPVESELPKIQGTGDVVVLIGMKITQWNGTTMAVSSRSSTWVIFPAMSIPERAPAKNCQLKHIKEARASVPSSEMMLFAVSLCNSRDRSSFTITSAAASSTTQIVPQAASSDISPPSGNGNSSTIGARREKFALIKDMMINIFYDLVGEVVKTFPSNGSVEIYITDYTSNSLLYNYEWGQDDGGEGLSRDGDDYGYVPRTSSKRKWPGPWGKMTLTVTLWPPHAYFAQGNLKDGDFVHIRNMRAKYSRDAKMEGVLHSDRLWPDRVDITVLDRDDDRVKDVLRRKREYNKQFKAQSQAFVEESRGQKRKPAQDEKPLTKAQAKKIRKQEREKPTLPQLRESQKETRPQGKENNNKKPNLQNVRNQTPYTSPPPMKPVKLDLNKNGKPHPTHHNQSFIPQLTPSPSVKSCHQLIPPRPLSAILSLSTHALTTPNGTPYTLPFQNIKSRTTARIIDFFPPNLADFAVRPRKPSEFDVLSDQDDDSEGDGSTSPNSDLEVTENEVQCWEWRFALVLEEAGTPAVKGAAKATMTVYVANEDAEFLLRLDAENLRTNQQALAALREKLFLLLGDLEERKRAESMRQREGRKAMREVEGNGQERREREEGLRGKAFECCLKEYGVRRRRSVGSREECEDESLGWERMWRMFGTTIV